MESQRVEYDWSDLAHMHEYLLVAFQKLYLADKFSMAFGIWACLQVTIVSEKQFNWS